MDGKPCPKSSASGSAERRRHAAVALLGLILPVAAAHVCAQQQEEKQQQPETVKPIAAVLKLHTFNFTYRSSNAYFSCHDLEHHVSVILRALGARDDVDVNASGCDLIGLGPDDPATRWPASSDPRQTASDPWRTSSDPWSSSSSRFDRDVTQEQSARVRVSAMMPIEVTPEVLAEIDKDKSRRELISRVTGNSAKSDDPIVFPAQRVPVELSHRTIGLEPRDCELLEEMSRSVFRKLQLRVVRESSCDRREMSRLPPQLTVEALMPVMPRTPQIAPAAGEDDPETKR
jgi:hypothetical protein